MHKSQVDGDEILTAEFNMCADTVGPFKKQMPKDIVDHVPSNFTLNKTLRSCLYAGSYQDRSERRIWRHSFSRNDHSVSAVFLKDI